MKQYCRHCAHCTQQDEDAFVCTAGGIRHGWCFNGQEIRRLNKCEQFSFNEIAADNPDVTYKLRGTRRKQQTANGMQESFLEAMQ